MRIELRVRRFFCDMEYCGHYIFTERLPKTAEQYARRTGRLSDASKRIPLLAEPSRYAPSEASSSERSDIEVA
jgi:hypothetical protein